MSSPTLTCGDECGVGPLVRSEGVGKKILEENGWGGGERGGGGRGKRRHDPGCS